MPVVRQTQNDEIGFEIVRSLQDLFARDPELDHKFRLDCHWAILQSQVLEPFLASQAGLISHLQEIARAGPMKTLWKRGGGKDVERNESCPEMIGE